MCCNYKLNLKKRMVIYLGEDRNIQYKKQKDDKEHKFFDDIDVKDIVRYLKGIYTNKERFLNRCMPFFDTTCCPYVEALSKVMIELYDEVQPYTYKECFEIENEEYRNLVFGSINIVDMINELGNVRVATEGKAVKHKQFAPNGDFLGYKEYDVIYETHRIDCSKLKVDDSYAVRCWCTSTDEEHWIWITDEHKDNPLEAIASTFMVHQSVKPYIKELKRQGDILLVELTQEVTIPEKDPMVSLTADEYFGLLTAQS